MGFPAQLDRDDLHFPDDDRVSHFAAREFQIILRGVAILAMVSTAVMMATFWFFAWVPTLVLLLCYVGLAVINQVEQRTRVERYERESHRHRAELAHELDPEADTPLAGQLLARDEEHFTPMPLLRKEGVIGLEIVIGLALTAVALVIVGIVSGSLPGELVAIAGGLIFCYGFMAMAPVWLGWVGDMEEEERDKMGNESTART